MWSRRVRMFQLTHASRWTAASALARQWKFLKTVRWGAKLPIWSEGPLHFCRGTLERSRLLNCLGNSMSSPRLTGWGDASLWKRSASCDSFCKIASRSYSRAFLNFTYKLFATIVDYCGNIDFIFRPVRRVIVRFFPDGRCLMRMPPCRDNDSSLCWIFSHIQPEYSWKSGWRVHQDSSSTGVMGTLRRVECHICLGYTRSLLNKKGVLCRRLPFA